MDYEQECNVQQPQSPVSPPPPPPVYQRPVYELPRKKGGFWRILWRVVFVLSILANGFLLLAVFGMSVMLATTVTQEDITEDVVVEGERFQKIAVIHIDGLIDGMMSDWVHTQLEAAENDPAVQGLIVAINSPGGGVAASDQIHYLINRYRERTGNPALAFMQSMATSGGYYSAVACDAIIAEPTAITGSIGVIMNHMVIKDLLEQKLGINPVVIKSGQRKDWPSMFSETTEEQRQYLDERIIQPAYERFVQLVVEGRKDKLTEDEVRTLADGGIFTAPDALTSKLIDQIGYFEQAVEMIGEMASVSQPTVVEYSPRFSIWSVLGAESRQGRFLSVETLERLLTPQLLYLWDGNR